MAAPDPGLSAYAAVRPCQVRRFLIQSGQTAVLADHGMFPLNGQNIDTPSRTSGTKWTTDSDTHPTT